MMPVVRQANRQKVGILDTNDEGLHSIDPDRVIRPNASNEPLDIVMVSHNCSRPSFWVAGRLPT